MADLKDIVGVKAKLSAGKVIECPRVNLFERGLDIEPARNHMPERKGLFEIGIRKNQIVMLKRRQPLDYLLKNALRNYRITVSTGKQENAFEAICPFGGANLFEILVFGDKSESGCFLFANRHRHKTLHQSGDETRRHRVTAAPNKVFPEVAGKGIQLFVAGLLQRSFIPVRYLIGMKKSH